MNTYQNTLHSNVISQSRKISLLQKLLNGYNIELKHNLLQNVSELTTGHGKANVAPHVCLVTKQQTKNLRNKEKYLTSGFRLNCIYNVSLMYI